MSWHSIRGHDRIVEQFRQALSRRRLASTFLFIGPAGIGKRTFALKLAQALLCERREEVQLDPCEECPSCRQVVAATHPDVHLIAKPPDQSRIPLRLLIGEDENRMREGLCYDLAVRPHSGKRKIAIIDDADFLAAGQQESANCLLKTLEEPPPRSVLILIGTSEQRQLPTIRSRCQIIRFQPLPERDVAELVLDSGFCADARLAQAAAAKSNGSLERAVLWTDDGLIEFQRELLALLAQPELDLQPAAKLVGQFVDEAGKESAAKRLRLRLVVSLAEEFYRAMFVNVETDETPRDTQFASTILAASKWMPAGASGACLEVCLEAYAHIDANANQATLIEWWLDELTVAARTGRLAA